MKHSYLILLICLTVDNLKPALGQDAYLDERGIDAYRLQQQPYNLTGHKIAIGQIEIGRAGKFGWDKLANWKPSFSLAGMFYRDRPSEMNDYLDNHAAMVAGVLVGKDKRFPGVAPGARLYAAAVGPLRESLQPEECLTSQFLSQQNGGDIRAINFSFGESLKRDPRPDAQLDGEALLSQCIDWLTRTKNVLFAIAGNQGEGGIPIPTDQYNGMTIAYSTQLQGQFSKVDFANLSRFPQGIGSRRIEQEININQRAGIALIAPGSRISSYDLTGKLKVVTGSSFAAPLVTGTVALLQEYSDRLLKMRVPNWSLAARQPEVMKAILMNSTDKLKDDYKGNLLGMTRTIFTQKNQTWYDAMAYRDPKIPLDWEMGTGQLNSFRAYQQFSAGQWPADQFIPALGWDYAQLFPNTYQDYWLEKPLLKDSFVAITLVWNRWVELKDSNQNREYDLGESFTTLGLNNLDLALVESDDKQQSSLTSESAKALNEQPNITCLSASKVDNVEHIFCPIPKTGHYKIRVNYTQANYFIKQPYALSWWTVSPPD
ncbi:MAG: S8 family serine peptidase [Microcystaceae cyanobacterium]